MRYLITTKTLPPAFTDLFEAENHFSEDVGMVVYDLQNCKYTTNGHTWEEIEIDHL